MEDALQGKRAGVLNGRSTPPTPTPKLLYVRNHRQSEQGILMHRMMNLQQDVWSAKMAAKPQGRIRR